MDNQLIRIKDTVMARIDPGRDVPEDEIRQIIDNVLRDYSSEYMLPAKKKLEYRKILFNDIKRLDILQEIIDDDSVTEIMVNGWNKIFIEQDGVIRKWDKKFDEPKRLNDIVQRIASSANKIVNESVPIADTKLADGSRVNIVMNPVAIDGPIITIRKFYNTPLSMEKMIEIGSVSEEAAGFLASLVKARYNIFISGGTGSGKTTFLNALSSYIPGGERVITIEDSAELKLMNIDNLVRLEARNANVEGRNVVTIRDLIKSALRMRPEGIKIKKGKSEHNKKSFPIPLAFLQYIPGNSIPLISGKVIKIIKEADDLIPLFHSILIFHSSSPLFSRLAGGFSLQVVIFTI